MALKQCVTGVAYEMRLVLRGINEWKDVGGAENPSAIGERGCMRYERKPGSCSS